MKARENTMTVKRKNIKKAYIEESSTMTEMKNSTNGTKIVENDLENISGGRIGGIVATPMVDFIAVKLRKRALKKAQEKAR